MRLFDVIPASGVVTSLFAGVLGLTPRGDVDGLILADGTEIHTPPHLGTQLGPNRNGCKW